MIAGLHHVAISTPDAERLIAFYGDQLGLEVCFDQSWPAGVAAADAVLGLEGSAGRQVLMALPGAYLEIFQFASPEGACADPRRRVCDHGITHLCLDVEDVDDAYVRLSAAGVRFHAPPQDLGGGVRTTYARDPDGNVVELQQLTEGHPFAASSAAASRRTPSLIAAGGIEP